MTRYCKHCGVDAPNADQCGTIIVGTRREFVEGNTPGNYLHPVNFIELFPSHILHICIHICILFAFDELMPFYFFDHTEGQHQDDIAGMYVTVIFHDQNNIC